MRKSQLLLQNSFLCACVWTALFCATLLEICPRHCGFIPLYHTLRYVKKNSKTLKCPQVYILKVSCKGEKDMTELEEF